LAAPHRRARAALGARLRQLREQAGLTGAQLAEALGGTWSQSKVSKLETARRLPAVEDLQAWAAATSVAPAELLALLERARSEYSTFRALYREAGGVDAAQGALAAAEAAAKWIGRYQPAVVIGLLQTQEYAWDVLHLPGAPADAGASDEEIRRTIASRLRRQAVLYEPGREIVLVMSEGALRTRVSSPATMRAQLAHIAHVAETAPPNVTVGVVPFAAPAPTVPLSGFGILDDVVTIEHSGGELELADPAEVERYMRYLELLRDVAVTGPEAAELCQRVAAESHDDG